MARGRVRLEDYKLALIGNHCEFTTLESYRRFAEYLGKGGGVLIHGEERNVIGAVGISGDTSDRDEDCALSGVRATGLQP